MLLFVALIYKGKRLLVHETNRNDTQSVLLPEGKRVCVYVSREWLGSLVSRFISVVFLSLALLTSSFFHRI